MEKIQKLQCYDIGIVTHLILLTSVNKAPGKKVSDIIFHHGVLN